MSDLLQELSSSSDSDSSGEESGGEEDKKEEAVDEDDLAEQAKLPQYVTRFKVGFCFLSWGGGGGGVRFVSVCQPCNTLVTRPGCTLPLAQSQLCSIVKCRGMIF